MTERELERLLTLLTKLSEQTDPGSGQLRDYIANVRNYVWGKLDD